MARQRRINEPGTYHHITARGVDRCDVFVDDHDRRQFLALLGEARNRFGCQVLAFCLMTNHIHLTIRDDRGTLSKTQHFLNGVYAKRFNHKHGRTGHLFERRFWSSRLDSDAYLSTCVEYVHRNPVEAGIVDNAEDYRWSSYASYVGLRSKPGFLDTSIVLSHYGDDVSQLRERTEGDIDRNPVAHQIRSANPPAVLGADCGKQLAETQKDVMSTMVRTPLNSILEACAAAFHIDVSEVRAGTRGRRNPARGMTALIAHRHVGHSLNDVAAALGLNSPAAASLAAQRFADALPEEHEQPLAQALASLGLASTQLIT